MPRKAKTSRDMVLAAALTLVDALGLEGLSMRRLAKAVGVEAMSLYRHLPNKTAILDGIHEAVLTQMVIPPRSGDWKEDARALARSFRSVLDAHPNVVVLFASRPAVTPGSLDYIERGLEILEEPLPDPLIRIHAFQSLFAFVVGHAMTESHASTIPGASVDYGALEPDRHPQLRSSATALAQSRAEDEFEFGLEAFLTGVAARSA